MSSITATLDRVLFFNEASKYCVLRMKTANNIIPADAQSPYQYSDHLIRFTAVGYDLPRTSSVQIEVDGVWQNGKYGCQLQVEHWHEIVPPTLEGIRGYLSSGLLKGIGEKTADAIIQRFGIDSLHILENEPERLLEIRGITEEKLEEIKDGYAKSKAMRDLMTLLAPFKVTPTTALKIYEHFGPNGVKLLHQSPFRLCQMPNFGFKKVDAIVQKSGGDLHDPMRIQGALFYVLESSRSDNGHLYFTARELIKESLLLLNENIPQSELQLSREQVEDNLADMILNNVVVSNKGNIYLPHVYTHESETAYKVAQMALEVPEPVHLSPVMERVKSSLGIRLSKRQTAGVEMVFRHNLSIITGGPGTGKSTILKAVIETYRRLYPSNTIKLATPTGKASRRMAETTGILQAQTMHSLLGLHSGDPLQKKPQYLDADLVVIDEASMIDMWLAWQLFRRLRPGTKLLLVGDADQLESVGAGNVFHELMNCGVVPVTVLDEIFRQAQDSPIPHNAKAINEGSSELYFCKDFAFVPVDSQEEAADMVRSLYKKEVAQLGTDQVQILSPYRSRGEASSDHLNEMIREEINPPSLDKPEIMFGGSMFRVNDRVMQTKNNNSIQLRDADGNELPQGVFNGEVGTIHDIILNKVVVNFDGRYAEYHPDGLSELKLSYATTIHKSQGTEYDTVIIPLLMAHRIMLSRNLIYTAVTRAKRRVLLIGQKKALYTAIHTSRMGKRKTLLAERIRENHQNLTSKASTDSTPLKMAG